MVSAGSGSLTVVFVGEHFWPEVGGLERSTERLGAELSRLGHRVRMVTRCMPGAAASETRSGIQVTRHDHGLSPFTEHAVKAGEFRDADVVCLFGIGHDPVARWWRPVLEAQLAPNGVRLLKVGTDQDITSRGLPAMLYRRLDGVLCQTIVIAKEAIAIGVEPARCFPIRNGLDMAAWRTRMPSKADARSMLQISADSFVVLGLGRFVKRKRFRELVRAYSDFARNAPGDRPPELILHGSDFDQDDGEEKELRTAATDSGVRVRFVPPEVDSVVTLAASDVLVTLSEREGAPNVLLEALASARPAIVSDLPGHRVYVTDKQQGLIVGVGAVDAAADALRKLYGSSQLLQSFGETAGESAGRFDIAETAKDYLTAFTAVRERAVSAGAR